MQNHANEKEEQDIKSGHSNLYFYTLSFVRFQGVLIRHSIVKWSSSKILQEGKSVLNNIHAFKSAHFKSVKN